MFQLENFLSRYMIQAGGFLSTWKVRRFFKQVYVLGGLFFQAGICFRWAVSKRLENICLEI